MHMTRVAIDRLAQGTLVGAEALIPGISAATNGKSNAQVRKAMRAEHNLATIDLMHCSEVLARRVIASTSVE